MRKSDFKKVALLGLTAGFMTGSLMAKEPTKNNNQPKEEYDPNDGNLGYHLMSEEELTLELNEEGTRMYKSLSPEGKELVLKVASMRCKASNFCQGLNACKTDEHDCAGKGKCKGTGKCGLSDKNLAVKLVYNKMKNKRNEMMQQNQNQNQKSQKKY